ncbi:MAG: cell wall-binding protein, partial [Hungatella sp.]
MKKLKRVMAMALTAGMLTGMFSMPIYAADKKVTGISLVVESNLKVGQEYQIDDVTITTKGDNYLVGDIAFINEGYEWGATDIPTIEVYIEAADGYYLSLITKNIKIKGATYKSGKKVDSKTALLTLALPSLRETVGEVADVKWSSQTAGSWTEAYNAGSYEVKLYRDSTLVRSTQKTATNQFDFISMMTKE